MGQVENVLGTLLIGIFFNTYLYGVVSFQYFSYFSSKIRDAFAMKAIVALLFANDTFQSALVRNFVNPVFMNYITWPYAYVPIGTAITAVATHLPLASRIYFMSKKKWIFVLLLLGSLGSLGTGFALGVFVWTLKDIHRADRLLKTLVTVWLGIQAALDVMLAVLSTMFLHNQGKGADQKTSSVINRLILGSVQAGVVPVLFGAAALATFYLFIMFVIPLGRTYTIAFVNGLNVREELKERLLGSQESADPVVVQDSLIQ
ncbi:hypothetical protein CPB83DRAFT_834451 [Crepidotus variabilis]|uniref:DUF6534 domain-containing protein n=1 Tax=Crepidotus variabilis TaxID=179855 RepID=A0A9P6EK82_9AGAR|nr:hypothetical protein CPB83DRAFT_834451 [Crepidotus variabilis]